MSPVTRSGPCLQLERLDRPGDLHRVRAEDGIEVVYDSNDVSATVHLSGAVPTQGLLPLLSVPLAGVLSEQQRPAGCRHGTERRLTALQVFRYPVRFIQPGRLDQGLPAHRRAAADPLPDLRLELRPGPGPTHLRPVEVGPPQPREGVAWYTAVAPLQAPRTQG